MDEHGTTIVRGLTLVEALDTRRNEVWRAVPAGGGRHAADVAVKLLHPAYEPIVPQRFRRRGRTLTRIVDGCRGWVPLLDHGYTTDGRRYVVSPLHRGSLADQLDHGPTPWFPAARLIADASFAMSEAHGAGYSFGHLRPSGILLNGPTEVRIVAYGTSTRRFDDGTAQFMAPELADDGRPLPPSDVYSLALILASLIAGRPIDHGESRSAVVNELAGSAPARVVDIVEYGLSAGIRNRYADAGKFATTLEAALQDQHDTTRRGRAAPPPDALDPLPALLAEPLVGVQARHPSDGIPDRRDSRHPDDTPTAVPFDAPFVEPLIEIDDPTDPGLGAPGELDTETDHFGTLAHPEVRSATRNRPTAGPLADLLAETDPRPENEPAPERQATTRPPGTGSIIDVEEGFEGGVPAAPQRHGPGPTEPGTSTIEPSRMSVLADNVGNFLTRHRRRMASPVPTGETSTIGEAATPERPTGRTEASTSTPKRRRPPTHRDR